MSDPHPSWVRSHHGAATRLHRKYPRASRLENAIQTTAAIIFAAVFWYVTFYNAFSDFRAALSYWK